MRRRCYQNVIEDPLLWYKADNLVFTGSNCVDTGIKLCDVNKAFTLVISYQSYMSADSDYHDILGCEMSSSPYSGIMIQLDINNNNGRCGGNNKTLVHHNSSMVTYRKCTILTFTSLGYRYCYTNDKYPNGADISPSSVLHHNRSAVLGAGLLNDTEYRRYWKGIIYHCEIRGEVLTQSEITTLLNKYS